jgi:hypothetical protein
LRETQRLRGTKTFENQNGYAEAKPLRDATLVALGSRSPAPRAEAPIGRRSLWAECPEVGSAGGVPTAAECRGGCAAGLGRPPLVECPKAAAGGVPQPRAECRGAPSAAPGKAGGKVPARGYSGRSARTCGRSANAGGVPRRAECRARPTRLGGRSAREWGFRAECPELRAECSELRAECLPRAECPERRELKRLRGTKTVEGTEHKTTWTQNR